MDVNILQFVNIYNLDLGPFKQKPFQALCKILQ